MSQLQLFNYSDLSPDLQVEVKTATERIKLRMKRTGEDIIEIGKDLIAIKEKLPHGSFLPWIATEFEMNRGMANVFMQAAERFGGMSEIQTFKPSIIYLLASPSTPDEVVEQVIEKAENGETVTAKEVKELKAKIKELESDKATLDRRVSEQSTLIDSQNQEIETKGDLLTKANLLVQSEAERLAEQKAQKLKAEFEIKLQSLESDKAKAEEASKKAKSDYESALAKFKANPDPETQKAILDLKDQFERTKGEVDRVQHSLENLKQKEDQTFSVALSLERFHGAFQKLISNHPDAIVAMSSPYLDDRQVGGIELLAETLEDWAERIRHSVNLSRESNATAIRAVEVEVLEDGDDF